MIDEQSRETEGEPRQPRLLFVGAEGLNEWPGNSGIEVVGIVDVYGEWAAPADFAAAACSGSAKPQHLHPQLQRCPLYATLDEALALSSPDTAFVSVPNNRKTSFAVMERLLREPVHVLAKKLRLHAMSDVDRLSELSKAGTGRLFVGEHYRYIPSVRALKGLLEEGRLGTVEQVTWRCRLPYEVYDWMGSYRHLALEDLAYHHFGVLHDLFGFDPVRLYAHSFEPASSEAGTRTVASVLAATPAYHLSYETIWCSKRDPYSYLGEVSMEGAEGSAVLTDSSLRWYSDGRERSVACPASRYDGPWGLIDHWLDTFAENASSAQPASSAPSDAVPWLPYTFEQFEPVLRAIYRAVDSAENGVAK